MHTLVRGNKLWWSERGRGGTPLVLLHAFPFDHRMWDALSDELSMDARIVAPDFPGLGQSEGTATIEEAADAIAALLDHLHIDRTVVGGLSMGGYVSLAFARRHPSRLLGLLLADTRAGADSPEGRAGRDEAIARVAREGLRTYTEELAQKLLAGHDPQALAYARALMQLQSPVGVVGALASLRDRPDATPGLAAVRVPTTVIVGSEDALTPPAEAKNLAAAIADAELVELPRAGHLSVLEALPGFAGAVRDLLRRVAARGHGP